MNVTHRFASPVARLFAVLSIALFLLSGCGESGSPPSGSGTPTPTPTGGASGAKGETIKVGHYGSLTGAQATFGKTTDDGIKLAIEEINAAGGLNGKKIELITYDTRSDVTETTNVVTRLIDQDKVVALLGEVASKRSIAGGGIAEQKGIPMISPSSTNPEVTRNKQMVFRVCYLDTFQGYVMAKFARENLKVKKVAVLFDKAETYSTGLAEFFQTPFKEMGGEITTVQNFKGGDPDFSAQLTEIRSSGAEAIYIPAYYNEVASIAKQARKLGIKVPLLGADGWESPKLIELGGEDLEGCYYSNHYAPEEQRAEVTNYLANYKKKYGEESGALAALGYDSAMLLFDAMKRSKSLSGKDLAQAIADTKDFKGVTGNISIDKGHNAEKTAVVLAVKGGKSVYVETMSPPKK